MIVWLQTILSTYIVCFKVLKMIHGRYELLINCRFCLDLKCWSLMRRRISPSPLLLGGVGISMKWHLVGYWERAFAGVTRTLVPSRIFCVLAAMKYAHFTRHNFYQDTQCCHYKVHSIATSHRQVDQLTKNKNPPWCPFFLFLHSLSFLSFSALTLPL